MFKLSYSSWKYKFAEKNKCIVSKVFGIVQVLKVVWYCPSLLVVWYCLSLQVLWYCPTRNQENILCLVDTDSLDLLGCRLTVENNVKVFYLYRLNTIYSMPTSFRHCWCSCLERENGIRMWLKGEEILHGLDIMQLKCFFTDSVLLARSVIELQCLYVKQ